eukprot:1136593-Amphidinium_carterae.1
MSSIKCISSRFPMSPLSSASYLRNMTRIRATSTALQGWEDYHQDRTYCSDNLPKLQSLSLHVLSDF